MSSLTHASPPEQDEVQRGRSLLLVSFLMLPAYFVAWYLVALVSVPLLPLFGFDVSHLVLLTHTVTAWIITLTGYALMAVPAVVGIVLAVRALRTPSRWWAVVAIVLNAALVLLSIAGVVHEAALGYGLMT